MFIDFTDLGRKYEWSYAQNDTSVVEWLLFIARSHEVKITIVGGFSYDEVAKLLDNECFSIGNHSTLPKVLEPRSIRRTAA